MTFDQRRGWQGGTFEMCQLWLNLPAKNKMDPPNYQVQVRRGIFCALLCSFVLFSSGYGQQIHDGVTDT